MNLKKIAHETIVKCEAKKEKSSELTQHVINHL